MKKTFLFLFMAFITTGIISQEKNDDKENNIKTINFVDGNSEDVPFTLIDKVPVFPGCEKYETNSKKKYCLNQMMLQHIAKNFNINIADGLKTLSPGRKKIYLEFKIGKNGHVEDISAKAPHEKLKEEAIRVAKLLPVMIPGSHKNKNVRVGYTLPIAFNVE
ncbi:hypothetical protein F7018_07645 [Tenacibaculum aiptasiae]|uniref:TonB C-terminal domain-containing protein n=1 Tax=Tenacibaculum aiptasiae TaxID=426481 RepID=A0A7J5AN78_9FLAO|nr:energy transducer TonB [Tenacibaculum aiptasiae]KAB1158970.1 hypothetical protein F7018_07645 [Tenacibaculum aiptasiae]